MFTLPLRAAAAALAIFAVTLPAGLAKADDQSPKAAAPKAAFSEKHISNFVAAAKEVYAIRQKYAPQFRAANSDADKKQIVLTAQGEMEKAIQGNGLTVQQYNEVLVAAKDDQALADRIGRMMDSGGAKEGG